MVYYIEKTISKTVIHKIEAKNADDAKMKIEKGEIGEIVETFAKRSLRNVSGAYKK